MSEVNPDQNFDELLSLFLEDELNEDQMREFVSLVKSNSQYYSELSMHLTIDKRLDLSEKQDDFAKDIESILDEQEDEFTSNIMKLTEHKKVVSTKTPWMITAASIAASLLMGFLLFLNQSNVYEDLDDGVAVISHIAGNLNIDLEKGDSIAPGLIELSNGYLVLEFYQGARMSVAAPAKLELVDAMNVICYQGKIRTYVPQVAIGFTITTPESKVVDLGTEFGIDVEASGHTEVHVFDGEVEAYDLDENTSSKKLLTAGKALKASNGEAIPADHQRFNDLLQVANLERQVVDQRLNKWRAQNTKLKKDDRLIVYYDFEPDPVFRRSLKNQSVQGPKYNGAIVGATWSNGPWPGKQALDFKRPSDRVRVNIPGEYESLTYAAWVRVDALDRSNISLLLTDGYDEGEVHWQLKRDGKLSLGMYHNKTKKQGYISKRVMDKTKLGKWMHLSTVIDHKAGKVTHYKNGEVVLEKELATKDPHRLGFSSIGNWDEPIETPGKVRNLNGAIAELMVFKSALNKREIEQLALK